MTHSELACKKIANRMLFVLSEHLHPTSVEFAEDGKSMGILKSAVQCTVSVDSEDASERAAENLLEFCSGFIVTEFVELLLPPEIPGIVATACNISIRVLVETLSSPPRFRADICFR